MQKLEKLVFVHYNVMLKARNLQRRDHGNYDPINLDYIFEEDDPLDDWLVDGEFPVLSNTDFLNEAMVDVDDFESDQEGEGQCHHLPFADLLQRVKREKRWQRHHHKVHNVSSVVRAMSQR
eukprot:TRINITY_DN4296_c0_g1_i1.p2 TRINITY_DN4296_c0_g1~~TRINITY_DN4296_c0_g1_i1.p2  ORF type:complete len:121 (+),score=22.33 TRINITY_DN4296_c0_g1_i1:1962-2324(+)